MQKHGMKGGNGETLSNRINWFSTTAKSRKRWQRNRSECFIRKQRRLHSEDWPWRHLYQGDKEAWSRPTSYLVRADIPPHTEGPPMINEYFEDFSSKCPSKNKQQCIRTGFVCTEFMCPSFPEKEESEKSLLESGLLQREDINGP